MSPAPPTPPVVSRCHTSQLRGKFVDFPDGAAGNDRFDVLMTNISNVNCTVYGYPGLGFLTSDRHILNIPVYRGSGMLTPDPGPHQVTLPPGQTASASVGYSPNCPPNQTAAQPGYLEITPPDETDFLLAPVTMPAGSRLLICGNGVSITAAVAGSKGVPT